MDSIALEERVLVLEVVAAALRFVAGFVAGEPAALRFGAWRRANGQRES